MRHPIDPKVDCVFKTLFGSDDHRDLLIHFLNALLADDLAAPITDVDILNPYNERETLDSGIAPSTPIATGCATTAVQRSLITGPSASSH
ncbi:PD-(D/E)XK nuclease family transposase [Thiocapsa sp.]|uniref:PD-(D/E)XK nuclease family transposase n=1 Tax=Thiocapsa sp. TaxID=2024551 RepID=UPI002CE7F2F5|nr:PD-(D/E)XK nuclease family transposase [Thiocapsa sp.]HSO82886.1 PD-(D/E)XK nuclease family transposase [Thiocapsa sp.]